MPAGMGFATGSRADPGRTFGKPINAALAAAYLAPGHHWRTQPQPPPTADPGIPTDALICRKVALGCRA